jgi:hypothetical protein
LWASYSKFKMTCSLKRKNEFGTKKQLEIITIA